MQPSAGHRPLKKEQRGESGNGGQKETDDHDAGPEIRGGISDPLHVQKESAADGRDRREERITERVVPF